MKQSSERERCSFPKTIYKKGRFNKKIMSFSIHTQYISGYTQIFLKVFDNTKIALLYKFS